MGDLEKIDAPQSLRGRIGRFGLGRPGGLTPRGGGRQGILGRPGGLTTGGFLLLLSHIELGTRLSSFFSNGRIEFSSKPFTIATTNTHR